VGFVGASLSSCLALSTFTSRTMQVQCSLATKAEYFITSPVPSKPPAVSVDCGDQRRRCQRNGSQLDTTTTYGGHDFCGYGLLSHFPFSYPYVDNASTTAPFFMSH
jgi:hypothetical protein